jgi:membrane protein YqaA with SNARE-associated domain
VAAVPTEPEPHDAPDDAPSLAVLARQLAFGLAGLMVGVAVLAWTLRGPLEALAYAFTDRFGLAGIAVGVLLTDTMLLTHEPLLFAGYAGGLGFWPVFVVASAASVVAGPLGWVYGRLAGRLPWVQRMFRRYHLHAFLERYGFWAVAVAALTPFPYSAATIASGASGVSVRTVFLGSLFRIPKVLFYFLLIVGGWTAGGG